MRRRTVPNLGWIVALRHVRYYRPHGCLYRLVALLPFESWFDWIVEWTFHHNEEPLQLLSPSSTITNFTIYFCNDAFSTGHFLLINRWKQDCHIVLTFNVTFRNMGTLRNLKMSVLISFVSKMYPRGIQLRKRRRVSNVTPTSGGFCELSNTNSHNWNTSENWEHIVSFKRR